MLLWTAWDATRRRGALWLNKGQARTSARRGRGREPRKVLLSHACSCSSTRTPRDGISSFVRFLNVGKHLSLLVTMFVSLADLRGLSCPGLLEPRLRLLQLQEHECLGRRVLHGASMGAPKASIVLKGGAPFYGWAWGAHEKLELDI